MRMQLKLFFIASDQEVVAIHVSHLCACKIRANRHIQIHSKYTILTISFGEFRRNGR